MVQKTKGAKVYKTMQGKQVDMDLLRKRNEMTPAVGNAKINARGDELGPGGQVIRSREDVLKGYYENANPVVADENPVKRTEFMPPEEAVKNDDDWIEDEDGNFFQKGD
jgi:hypothetical protein